MRKLETYAVMWMMRAYGLIALATASVLAAQWLLGVPPHSWLRWNEALATAIFSLGFAQVIKEQADERNWRLEP